MEQQIVEGNIGTVGKYDLDFKEGALVLAVDAGVPQLTAKIEVKVPVRAVLEVIKAKIPGQIDDAVLELLAKALGV